MKGSERITTWTPEAQGVWRVELPNSFFGDYNPYQLTLSGGWLNYGQWHHRGDVYLNGEALYEKQSELSSTERSWSCQADEKTTTIRANSEASIFAHNLFVNCGYDYTPDTEPLWRRAQCGCAGHYRIDHQE